jgi:peptide/nickel transport system permease protein
MHMLGGSPFTKLLPTPEQQAIIRQEIHLTGLDQPIWMQYIHWLAQILHGDFGYTYQGHAPIIQVVMPSLENTLLLVGVAWVFSLLVAIPWGIYNGSQPYGYSDTISSLIGYVGFAMPAFWFGLMLQNLFAMTLFWLPPGNMYDMGHEGEVTNLLLHMLMPVTVIAAGLILGYMKYVRSHIIEVLPADFIRTARAKGASNTRILFHHAFRNALIPLITILAMDLPTLIGGTAIIEIVFNWPGVGALLVHSVYRREYTVILSIVLISSLLVVLANWMADVLYAVVDPRIRTDQTHGTGA